MKTQYPCNNTNNQIHIYKKYNKFHIAIMGSAIESPINCAIEGLGSDSLIEAKDKAAKWVNDNNISPVPDLVFKGSVF